ncbi:MAG: FtsW/RodA/SpoVE family cell cycle protein, partial [Planctomycetota bacterium]
MSACFFFPRESLAPPARWLVTACLLLLGIGLTVLFSASAYRAFALYGDPVRFLNRQFLGLVLGSAALLVASQIRPHLWLRIAPALLVVSVVLLAALFVPGIGVRRNYAVRWLALGPFGFQPSELVKLALPLGIAWSLARFGEHGSAEARPRLLLRTAQLLGVLAVGALVALEPDYGGAAFIVGVGLLLLLTAGVPLGYFVAGGILMAPAFLWLFQARRAELLQRFQGFLEPMQVYQVQRSLFGIGSGGAAGKGVGLGMEPAFYLPEAYNDFIFSVFAEETGFLGVVVLLGLFTLFLQSGWRIVRRC